MRIAVPNKGSLSEPAVEMLREAGYRVRRDSKELIVADPDNDVEFFYLRPRDVALYVGKGQVDAGITGRDLLLDSGSTATEVMGLGFGGSTSEGPSREIRVSVLSSSSISCAGSGSGAAIGGSTAIGNQLNVVVQGSWNTVIVNSNQTNNGDVTAGTALNGTLDLP